MADDDRGALLTLTADIVAAHVSNNSVSVGDLPQLIGNVHAALSGLGAQATAAPVEQAPAVSRKLSVKPDYIVCLEDGKKLVMLKRHLRTDHQMTPAEYRAKWQLPADYPIVAPNYSEKRRGLAHAIGLGRRGASTAAANGADEKGAAMKAGARKPRQARPKPAPSEG